MAKLALLFLFLFLFLHYLFYNFLLNKPFTPGSSPFILSRLAFRETVTVSQTKMAHTLRRRKYLYSLYRGAFSPSPRVYARFKGAMSLGYNLQTGTKEKDSVCMCWWRGGGGGGGVHRTFTVFQDYFPLQNASLGCNFAGFLCAVG